MVLALVYGARPFVVAFYEIAITRFGPYIEHFTVNDREILQVELSIVYR